MAEGVLTATGSKKWNTSTIHNILTNTTYTGVTYAYTVDKSARGRKRPKDQWILLPADTTPETITPEEFEAAQRILHRNSELSPRRQKNRYLFSGYAYCKQCHRRYHGTPNRHGTPYYRCSGHDSPIASGKRCTSLKIPAEMLDKKVWDMVISHVLDPKSVLASWQPKDRADDSPVKDWENERESCLRELQALENSYDKLINIYIYPDDRGEAQGKGRQDKRR